MKKKYVQQKKIMVLVRETTEPPITFNFSFAMRLMLIFHMCFG